MLKSGQSLAAFSNRNQYLSLLPPSSVPHGKSPAISLFGLRNLSLLLSMSTIRTPRPTRNVRKPYSLAESTVTASRHTTTKKNASVSPLHLAQFRIISKNYFDALPTDAVLEDYSLTDQERSLLISWTLDEDSVDEAALHPHLVELLPELSLKTRCHGVDLLLHRGRPVANSRGAGLYHHFYPC